MKKIIITSLILLVAFTSFGQKVNNKELNEIKQQISALKDSLKKIKQDEASMFLIKDKILNDKINYEKTNKDIINLSNELDEKFDTWIVKHIEATMAILGLITAIIFWIIGKRISAEKIRKEVEEKIATLTNIEETFIHKNLNEYKKHLGLKENAKILVINQKGTRFPDGFNKVLSLFKSYKEYKHKIEINGLKEALSNENIEKLKKADIVIIENQVEFDNNGNQVHWNIQIDRNCNTIDCIRDKIKTETDENKVLPYLNNLYLINLSNEICDTTAILYYGQAGKGNFPSNFVESDKQHMITFANAPSQLYGNMLNMLKFKNELDHA